MYFYGRPHMAEQKQDGQHEHTFSNYVRIRDVVQKTCQKRWTIGKSGEKGSGISVLAARHDDDDDVEEPLNSKVIKCFVPELRIRKCFSCFEIPMFYVYELWTLYVRFTHIRIWVWYTSRIIHFYMVSICYSSHYCHIFFEL